MDSQSFTFNVEQGVIRFFNGKEGEMCQFIDNECRTFEGKIALLSMNVHDDFAGFIEIIEMFINKIKLNKIIIQNNDCWEFIISVPIIGINEKIILIEDNKSVESSESFCLIEEKSFNSVENVLDLLKFDSTTRKEGITGDLINISTLTSKIWDFSLPTLVCRKLGLTNC